MDFAQWLYRNYIKGCVERCPQEGYKMELSFMDGELEPYQRECYDRVLEFWATRAFFLGVRTGAGLSGQLR